MNDPLSIRADAYVNNYTEAENQQFTAEFNDITQAFATAMADGVAPADQLVQNLVKRHYAFCSRFWTPNRDSYKSLALGYIVPSGYRDTYENVAKGLAQYHYDAIVIWADANLSN